MKSSQRMGAGRSLWRRPLRAALALITAAGLALGGAVLTSTAATAAPGDPITMPDDNLRAYMNSLIANATATARTPDQDITEGEAAAMSGIPVNLDPANLSGPVASLEGLQWFTSIPFFTAVDQPFTDLSPLPSNMGVGSIVSLTNTGVTAIPPLNISALLLDNNSGLASIDLDDLPNVFNLQAFQSSIDVVGSAPSLNLTQVIFGGIDSSLALASRMPVGDLSGLLNAPNVTTFVLVNTDFSDVTVLANMTSVTTGVLAYNGILDLSPLPDTFLLLNAGAPHIDRANGQEATVASITVGDSFANPVKDIDGTAVPVTSTDAGFSFDAVANTWSWDPVTTIPGTKTLTFANDPTDPSFSGTITQEVLGAITPGTPTISGTPTVGETLTADPGTWAPADAALAYEWLVDGTPVTGEMGTTFTPRAEDEGKDVTVRVTATKPGYTTASATSDPVTVAPGTITAGTPTISGTPTVGEVLTADPGTWAPADAILTYEWLVDGTPVTGETGTTFTPRAEDAGKDVTVRVTATKPGYTTASATSDPVTVAPGTITAGTPTISGIAQVGQPLTANPGTWQPADAELAYEWLVDGNPVAGETGTTFTPRPEDEGKEVAVRVTATKPGFTTAVATSDPVTVAPAAIVPPTAGPAILGLPQVGQQLTVQPGDWQPADATLDYQWYVDGVPVTGATGTTFTPSPEHAGKDVTVRVTASKPGYAPETANSDAVTIAVPQIASDKARAKVGENVTFTGVNFGPGEDVQLVLHSDPVPLGTVKADQNGAFSTTIVLPSGATVGDHSVVATGVDTKLSASVAFEVLATAGSGSSSESLQQTGATPSHALIIAAAVLLLAGLGLGGAQLIAKRRVG